MRKDYQNEEIDTSQPTVPDTVSAEEARRRGADDALFVAPLATPAAADSGFRDAAALATAGVLGSYRRALGWGSGRALGARTAVGPEYPD